MKRSLARTLLFCLAAGSFCSLLAETGCAEVAENPAADSVPPPAGATDYGAALRTAAIRLTGNLPPLADILKLQSAANPAATFDELVAGYAKRSIPAGITQ